MLGDWAQCVRCDICDYCMHMRVQSLAAIVGLLLCASSVPLSQLWHATHPPPHLLSMCTCLATLMCCIGRRAKSLSQCAALQWYCKHDPNTGELRDEPYNAALDSETGPSVAGRFLEWYVINDHRGYGKQVGEVTARRVRAAWIMPMPTNAG